VLRQLTSLPPTKLELAESLEQLRWLEHGYRIKTAITRYESFGIDTEDDLNRVLKMGLL
jgi:3-deoxy-manno-octulosonate cytidylyltransferase (CMP-KDO synthetase)